MGVEDTYDAIAGPYAERFHDEIDGKPFDRDLLGSLVLRADGPVADIGCGPGQIGRYLFDQGVDVIGIDRSAEMIAIARRQNPNVRFERADMRALPFDDDELAGAVAFYSMIHFDDLAPALTELHRVIRPNGFLCMSVHEGEGSHHLEQWFDLPVDIDVRLWSTAEVGDALAATGYRVESAVIRERYEGETTARLYVTAINR